MPLVSVVVACRNAERYVGKAIRSVLDQSFTDWELVAVDDNSADRSLAVIRELAESDPRIKVIASTVTLGAGAARNRAITEVAGEWLAVLDADDVYLQDKLDHQVSVIRSAGADLVLVGAGSFHVDQNGQRLASFKYPTSSAALKRHLQRRQAFPAHSSLMYRTAVVRAIGGFNPRFCHSEDYDLWLRLMKTGEFLCVPMCLVEYRLHDANVSRSVAGSGFSTLEYALAAWVCNALRSRGLFDPSGGADDELWHQFMEHIACVVRASGEYEFRHWKDSWRSPSVPADGGLTVRGPSRWLFLWHPDYVSRLLREHTDGGALTDHCLRSWLEIGQSPRALGTVARGLQWLGLRAGD